MKNLFIIFFPAIFFLSCEKDSLLFWDDARGADRDNDFVYHPSPVFDVIAPSSVKFGETARIQVRSQGNSGCSVFSHYRESQTGKNTINIRAIQKRPADVMCTDVLTTITSTYEFIPESRQKYTLNFWRGELYENDFITVQINVR
jgi:hypothetical protein